MEEKKKKKEKKKKISMIHYLYGCRFDCLIKLLWQNKFKIEKGKRLQTFFIAFVSLLLYPFALIEELFEKIFVYPRKMENEPFFVLGFWRSGTTYLQDILCLDKNYSYINTANTYTNNNCVLLKGIVNVFMKKYAGEFRFMDNMENAADSPCEEEFAIANKTSLSSVHMSTFILNRDYYRKFLFFDNMTERQKKRSKKLYERFVKKVYFINKKKPLILKSPDNTCHVQELNEMFPNAKYVYIYRNPYKVVCSFKHTITKMMEYFSLQGQGTEEEVEDVVIDIYKNAMKQYRKDKEIIKDKLVEIRYEDFVKDPMKYLESIYKNLEIGDFEKIKKTFQDYVDAQKNYKTNKYEIPERLKKKIQDNLSEFFDEYGYEM